MPIASAAARRRPALGCAPRGRILARLRPYPQQHAGDDHGRGQPLSHAHVQGQDAQEIVRLAEVFGREARDAVADQEHRRHLSHLAGLAGVQPQHDEQEHAFEQQLVDLRRMARHGGAALREHHRPGQRRVGRPAPELAVDEVAQAPGAQPRRHARGHEVHHLQEGLVARDREPDLRHDHAQHAAVEAHAALPDHEHLQRVLQVVLGLVEQAVAQAAAQHHAQHAEEQHVLDVLAAPGARPLDRGEGLVLQAQVDSM